MARDNPSNPYTQDPGHTQKDVPLPVQKAKVMVAGDHPEDDAFHTVRIRVYGDQATYIAPVVTPMFGSVWVPKEGEDVAVIYGNSDKPWVIGAWYPLDRVEDEVIDLPDYTAGDIRLGNESGSHVTVHDDGHISIRTAGRERVDIDHQSASVEMAADQSVVGDDNYYELNFDTVNDDPEDLFDSTDHSFTVRNGGQHRISATVEIPLPGQNNRYTLAIFKNGSVEKRKNRQSAVNAPLSITVETQRKFDADDTFDIRLRHNRGSASTVESDRVATEFNIQRKGI